MSRNKWLCLDCRVDTGKAGEHYMLLNEVWVRIHSTDQGMLCVGCAEQRLGRALLKEDFNQSYLNRSKSFSRSVRLVNRMKGK